MKKIYVFTLVFLLLGLLIFVGCGKAAQETPQEIRVGFPVPLTGAAAGFGQGLAFGAQAAVADVNKLGGVFVKELNKKLPVKLILADFETDAAKVGTLTEDMVARDKVHLLQSPNCPVQFQAPVSIVAERHKIPCITGGGPMETWQAVREVLSSPWQYSWYTGFGIAKIPVGPGDFRYGKPGYTLVDCVISPLKAVADKTNKTAAVLASDCPDGRGWYELFPPELAKLGYKTIGIDKRLGLFPSDTTDFTSIIQSFKNSQVEILVANCRAPDWAAFWRQSYSLGFKPKWVMASEAGLFYDNIISWGGDLPNGVCCEIWWSSRYKGAPGIGGTTAESLNQRWMDATKQTENQGVGSAYHSMQIMFNAVEKAGTLDGEKVNKAVAETDMDTISYRILFEQNSHVSPVPLFQGQWQKTNKPYIWEYEIVYSAHDFLPPTAKMLFPIP